MQELNNIGAGEAIQILECIQDGIFVVDRNRRIVYWNEGASQITGQPGVTMLNTLCSNNLIEETDPDGKPICQSFCPLTHTLTTGEGYHCRTWIKHASGESIPIAVQTYPLRDHEGKLIGAVEIFRNTSSETVVENSYKNVINLLDRLLPAFFFNDIFDKKKQILSPSGFITRRANLIILLYELAGFVDETDKLKPQTAFDFLNELHSQAQERAMQYGGMIEKFLSEGAFLLFNRAQAAVDFALELLDTDMASISKRTQEIGMKKLQLRITISSGLVLMGVVGGKDRAQATVLGKPVNTAMRMLEVRPYHDLLLTAEVRNQLIRPDVATLAINPDAHLGLPQLFARSLP